MFITKEILAT